MCAAMTCLYMPTNVELAIRRPIADEPPCGLLMMLSSNPQTCCLRSSNPSPVSRSYGQSARSFDQYVHLPLKLIVTPSAASIIHQPLHRTWRLGKDNEHEWGLFSRVGSGFTVTEPTATKETQTALKHGQS